MNIRKNKNYPTKKVEAGIGAGGLGLLVVWGLSQYGLEMPPEVAVVVGGLVVGAFQFAGAWLKRDDG